MPLELSYTLRNVLLGATLLGIASGVVGTFALLRRQSLVGDALAHAALPGVCIAFLLTGGKAPVALLLGALAAGILGSLLILVVVRFSRVKEDAAMGIVLSTFFGAGVVLLTYIQRRPAGNQSGLDRFLFGQAATLLASDVVLMAGITAAVLLVVALLYKEIAAATFDPGFAAGLGLPVRALDLLLTTLLVVVVVVGLQTVGVVLIVAALVTPAVAARQWTDRLGVMLALSAAIGGAAGAAGAVLSASVPTLPTGPTIVLVASVALIVSLLAAPRRGLLRARLEIWRLRRRIRRENLLKDVYTAGERAGDWRRPVSWPELMGMRGQGPAELRALARPLIRGERLAATVDGLRLTAAGIAAARAVVRKHRLWELYLTRRMEIAPDHVHRDAEAMEHALSDAAVADLDRLLGHPTVDPHGRAIPPAPAPDASGAASPAGVRGAR